MRTEPATRVVTANDENVPWGEPGHVRGVLRLGLTNPVPREAKPFSGAAWRRMLASMDKSPVAASLVIQRLGADGFSDGRRSPDAVIGVRRWPNEPDWARFTFFAPAAYTGWPGSPELQDRWAGFVRRQAAGIGARAGFMTDDPLPGSQTALEQVNRASVYPYRRATCCTATRGSRSSLPNWRLVWAARANRRPLQVRVRLRAQPAATSRACRCGRLSAVGVGRARPQPALPGSHCDRTGAPGAARLPDAMSALSAAASGATRRAAAPIWRIRRFETGASRRDGSAGCQHPPSLRSPPTWSGVSQPSGYEA